MDKPKRFAIIAILEAIIAQRMTKNDIDEASILIDNGMVRQALSRHLSYSAVSILMEAVKVGLKELENDAE